MKTIRLFLYLGLWICFACSSSSQNSKQEIALYKQQAQRVTIIRDDWGIPHIYGKTDADAVFGLMYAQCEESFERVERNYIEKLGRLSEIEGENYLLQDLQMQMLYDTAAAIEDYKNCPQWLRDLLQSFSNGIHYYLYRHPEIKPALLAKFEPWYPLLFTDGAYVATQTGGLQSADMKALFGKEITLQPNETESKATVVGSNGFAIAPSRTADKTTLLYINPHVSFYFRTEVHMSSEQGLNAYGAVTWGQFFVFQGFNEHCGWMHTFTAVDASDLYEENVIDKDGLMYYQYEGSLKPVTKKTVKLFYTNNGQRENKLVTTFATHHGPIVGMRNGKWLSLKANNRSLNGLLQSWQRTKAKNLEEFIKVLDLRSNASTNTIYADAQGNIAYWHGNFIPVRDSSIDPAYPLDGTSSKSEWKTIFNVSDLIHVINPSQGFIQNCNSTPFSVSGLNTIEKKYPAYMAPEGENFRSLYAVSQLSQQKQFTPDRLIDVGYSHYLAAFDTLLPPLLNDFDALAADNAYYAQLKEAIDSLRRWNRQSSVSSVASTIAILWAYTILSQNISIPHDIENDQTKAISWMVRNTSSLNRLQALAGIINGLKKVYNTWKIPWGEINRFQRSSGSLQPQFENNKQEFAVGLASAGLGSLPSFETVWHQGKQYGVAGNSFVAVVSFGAKIKAKSISTGGQSCSPSSKHFTDQVEEFIDGKLKDVYFYKEDVTAHAEKTYRPGEE
jgi:acyl-homoserine-lactone acylase